MYEEAFKALFVVVGLVFQETVPPFAVQVDAALRGHETAIKAVCWAVLVLIYLVTDWLRRRGWRRLAFIRRRQYPQAAFEGHWLQRVNNERPFGVSCIEYDTLGGDWVYRGFAFDEHMALKARWETRSIHYDAAQHSWHFAGKGALLAESGALTVQTNAFDIVVIMSLPTDCDVGMIDAKAADFNFQATAGSHRDCIFAITLMRAVGAGNLVDRIRAMAREQRKKLFALIDQAQQPGPDLAA